MDRPQSRARETRAEPHERRRRSGALDLDEFISLLKAAEQMGRARHSARTLEKAEIARALRDEVGLEWKAIGQRLGVAPTTAIYIYGCREPDSSATVVGPRRAIIATLGLDGPRVTELCMLDNQDMDLTTARFFIQDAKTETGVREAHPSARPRADATRTPAVLETAVAEPDAPATAASPRPAQIEPKNGRSPSQVTGLQRAHKAGKGMRASL